MITMNLPNLISFYPKVCVEVPTQMVDRKCRNVTRQNCDVVMKQQPKEECDLVPEKLKPVNICDYKPRPVEREVCLFVCFLVSQKNKFAA